MKESSKQRKQRAGGWWEPAMLLNPFWSF